MASTTAYPVAASGSLSLRTLYGWQFAENAGTPAAARVLLRDGGVSGAIIADIRLAGGESTGENYSTPIQTAGDLYVEVNAGVVRGAVYGE